MPNQWVTAKNLMGIPGLPGSIQGILQKANKEKWPYREVKCQGGQKGKRREYQVSLLPQSIQIALAAEKAKEIHPTPSKIVPLYNKDIIAKSMPVQLQSSATAPEWAKKISLARVDLVRAFMAERDAARSKKQSVTDAAKVFVKAYKAGMILPGIKKTIGSVSVSSLYGFEKTLKESNWDFYCLLPEWGNCRRGASMVTDDEKNYVLSFCLHQNKIKIGTAIDISKHLMERRGIVSPSHHSTIRRFVENFKNVHYDRWILAREGEKALRDKVAPYLERDDSVLAVGDVLVGDGHRCNFQVINPFTGKPCRPALIGFYDWSSRVMCGWSIMLEENVQAIAAALRMAILSLRKIPKYLYLDNGKAFKAKVFTQDINLEECGLYGMFGRLGIHTCFADFYKARSKSVERFWGILSDSFERLLPSFIGASIPDRPASLNRNEKFMAATFPQRIPSIPEVYQWLTSWQGYYLAMPHPNPFRRGPEGQRQTRGQVFESGRGLGVNPEELNYMMMSMEIRTIRQNGIHFLGRNYWNENLYGLKDRVVIRFAWEEMGSRIYVYDRNGGYLGRADRIESVHPMAALADNPGESYTDIQEGIKNQNRLVASTKKVVKLAKARGRKDIVDKLPWDEMIKIDPMLPEKVEKYESELRVTGCGERVEKPEEEFSPPPQPSPLHGEGDLVDAEPRFEYPFERYEYLINLAVQTQDQKDWIADYRTGRIFPGEWKMMYGGTKKRENNAIFD